MTWNEALKEVRELKAENEKLKEQNFLDSLDELLDDKNRLFKENSRLDKRFDECLAENERLSRTIDELNTEIRVWRDRSIGDAVKARSLKAEIEQQKIWVKHHQRSVELSFEREHKLKAENERLKTVLDKIGDEIAHAEVGDARISVEFIQDYINEYTAFTINKGE